MPSLRRPHGGLALVAVLDGCRRAGLSWAVSSTRDVGVCLEAWAQALAVARPEMCNREPGAPFTRLDGTGRLTAAGRQRSRDGRGRALANVWVARLWRTGQDEEVSGKDDETPHEAMQG